MKRFLMLFSIFALLLVGCGDKDTATKKETEEEKTPMQAMQDEFKAFEKEMESGYHFKYDDGELVIELYYLSDDEFVYKYADYEGVSTARCGVNGEYTYMFEGEGSYSPDPKQYCEDGFKWVVSAYNTAFESGYFNSAYDIDYSDEDDYYLATGEYQGSTEKYSFMLYKNGQSISFEDNTVTVVVEVGDVELP